MFVGASRVGRDTGLRQRFAQLAKKDGAALKQLSE